MVTAQDVAAALGDEIAAVRGDALRPIERVSPLSDCSAGALVYIKATDAPPAGLEVEGVTIICSAAVADRIDDERVTLLLSETPRLTFMRALGRFFPPPRPPAGVHPSAVVDAEAAVDPTASIGPNVTIGRGSVVGPRTVLHPNVTVYHGVRIGADVTVHSGTVIGADGFGYERSEDGALEKFVHVGGVVIEDGVEIGSNTSIDRGTLGDTIIRRGVRIDNQCHISHNVVIGADAAVIAQSMIGGSVRIGERAWLAPAAVVINQRRVGEEATVGLAAVVVKDVPPGATVMGSPAVPADEFRQQRQALKTLMNPAR